MLSDAMISLVEKQRLGFVATVSPDGFPSVSPKGTFVVIDKGTLAFGDIRSPNTIANLKVNSAVEVNFVDPLTRKGVRAKGTATILPKGASDFEANISRFERWGALATRIQNIVVISVSNAKPLSTPAYDDGAVEADLRAHWAETLLSE